MKTSLIFCLAFLTWIKGYCQATELGMIDSLMRTAYGRGIFNGNILIAQHGKIPYQKALGFADGSKRPPLSVEMKFDIGSISKEFNGMAIMLLAEKGKTFIGGHPQ